MIKFDKLRQEHQSLSQELSSQDVFKNRDRYAKLSKRFSFLEKLLALVDIRDQYLNEKKGLQGLIDEPSDDEAMKSLFCEEMESLILKIKSVDEEIEEKIFQESAPDHDVIIEIRSAAGGDEAALFVAALFKMYNHYCDLKGWSLEVLSSHPTEIKGFKEINFSVSGRGAFAHLKYESGVHRVQRVPVTESSGRIHTSTATVAMLIEPKEVELNINPEDLKIDTYRSSGAGGQHVNTTDSAVRITHLPTNIVVACQAERSQIKNREKAMRVLKARIMAGVREEEEKKVTTERRIQVGTGDRSEKIRTYNFPERRVTDHRINLTLYRLESILEGDLDEIVSSLIKAERKKIYEAQGLV
ncbi:MAG: peptide chain release factor 1 [Candidatus Omnitrophica bacterium]|nr:peptide chain release factor 1 [Candidatus Omnitrophota bacterium]